MRYLITGGAGFIGCHTCVELLAAGHDIVVVDNLANSRRESLHRVETLTDRNLDFHQVDLLDTQALAAVLAPGGIAAVVHFAGLKAVGESVQMPLRYYQNNIAGTLSLVEAMQQHGPRRLVFSSSATVYGDPHAVPITEDFPLAATNPYGRTKLFIEEILRDLAAGGDWSISLLRYFNPVGAHPSGRIGEDPRGIPNNLMPFLSQVAIGRLERLEVFGDDYNTPDGTGVRDYIHVTDLALGHVAAIEPVGDRSGGVITCNLGTGRGYSVLEMIEAFSRASGRKVPYEIGGRREGDIAACYADVTRARTELGWTATRGIDEMCADAWRWQSQNPDGFTSD